NSTPSCGLTRTTPWPRGGSPCCAGIEGLHGEPSGCNRYRDPGLSTPRVTAGGCMTVLEPTSLRPFDQEACEEVLRLIQSSQAGLALERLRLYQARDRRQSIEHQRACGLAYDHIGDFTSALPHWVRALHLTSRCRDQRARIRSGMADSIGRTGDLARAERMLQRCVAEIRSGGDPRAYEPWALSALGRIHFRRGTLSLAVAFFKKGLSILADSGADPQARNALMVNCSHAFMRWDRLAEADQLLSEAEAADGVKPVYYAAARLSRVTWALESEDFEACEDALAKVDDRIVGDYLRSRLVWLQYQG